MREVKIHGKVFNVAEEPKDYWGWVEEGRFDFEWKLYDEYLKPEHTFVDLGAWIGSHSLYASSIARRVVAIEPDPVAYEILTENVMLNSGCCEGADFRQTLDSKGFTKCEIHWYKHAVGEGKTLDLGSGFLGASTTRANPNEGGGIGPWVEGQTFTATCMSLKDIDSHGPLFIKMDVEGSEEQLLADLEFFKETRPALYVEFHPFWWKDEAHTRRDFVRVADLYKTVKQINANAYLLTN